MNVHQQPFLGGVAAFGVQILERRDELRVRQVRLLREERPPRRAVRVRVPQQQRVERERHGVLSVLLIVPVAAGEERGERCGAARGCDRCVTYRAEAERVEAVVAGDLGDGRLDGHLHRRARGHVERAGEGIERRGDGQHQGSRDGIRGTLGELRVPRGASTQLPLSP